MVSPERVCRRVSAAGWPERKRPLLGTSSQSPAQPPAQVTSRPPGSGWGSGAVEPREQSRAGNVRCWWHHSQRYSPFSVPAFARHLSVCPFSVCCWRELIAARESGTKERQDLEDEGEQRQQGKEDPGKRQNEIQSSALLAASPACAGPQHQVSPGAWGTFSKGRCCWVGPTADHLWGPRTVT